MQDQYGGGALPRSPQSPPLNTFRAGEQADVDLYRVNPHDRRGHTMQSFIHDYGEEEGMRHWQAARPDRAKVTLGQCASLDCMKEAEVFCHDCREAYCSYACLCTAHRTARITDHNRITYTLAGARRMIEGSEMYSPRKSSPIDDVQSRLADLRKSKAAAVAAEDYSAAQRYKEMLESLLASEATAYQVPYQQAGQQPGYSFAPSQHVLRSHSPPPPTYQSPGPFSPHGAWSM
eukprot:TRINITY_DN21492_c0_g1_i1.p1 TRINITY_DN21492_c0_g1~~TRINITY_DN21492_c0_g1_i1.p1  ORF type:complete len:248 (+),score=27.57 TRINITY_DN21492_c0_g1_i1:47-745(+)